MFNVDRTDIFIGSKTLKVFNTKTGDGYPEHIQEFMKLRTFVYEDKAGYLWPPYFYNTKK